jgi:hypothetical protein
MTRRNLIENNLCRIGQILNFGSEEIRKTLKNRNIFVMKAGFIIAALIACNLNSVCLKYLPLGSQDFQ